MAERHVVTALIDKRAELAGRIEGGFSGVIFIQYLSAIGVQVLHLEDC